MSINIVNRSMITMHNKKQQPKEVLRCFQIPSNDDIQIKASVLKTKQKQTAKIKSTVLKTMHSAEENLGVKKYVKN